MNNELNGTYYKKKRERDKENKALGRINASIVALQPPTNYRRISRCRKNLLNYAKTYHKHIFSIKFCADQIEQIKEFQKAILNNDSKAMAAMRGGGKTSICRVAIEWAILFGHSSFAVIVGATGADSKNNLDAIRISLETNDLLCEDFPHVCLPIRALEGSARKCNSQRVAEDPSLGDDREKIRTRMVWTTDTLQLPIIPNEILATYDKKWKNYCSGALIKSKSADGAIRGLNIGGMRPDLILIDDVETRETVKSQSRTTELKLRLETDIGGLASNDAVLRQIYIGTIMSEDSITASYTDPIQTPAYNGKRYKYLKKEPKNVNLWLEYIQIRQDGHFGGLEKSREFYRKNRKQMNLGAVVSWPEGYSKQKYDSAIEKYYALWADKKEFGLEYVACELQNDPSMLDDDTETKLTVEKITSSLNGFKRMRIPSECRTVCGFIDVHGGNSHLYYGLIAFDVNFNGCIIDYGTFPERKTLLEHYKIGKNDEILVRKGLEDLIQKLSERDYYTDNKVQLRPRFLIDSGWGATANVVYAFCRENQYRNAAPSKGWSKKFTDFNKTGTKNDTRGENWRLTTFGSDIKINGYLFSADYWKRFVHNRFLSEKGQGAMRLWGTVAQSHLVLSQHILAEKPKIIIEKSTGNQTEVWEQVKTKPNHWFDCVVGCCVLASITGINLKATKITQKKKRHKTIKATKI